MFEERRSKLVQALRSKHLDAAVLVPGAGMYYFTGLKLNHSERLTFAIITKKGELVLVFPQVEYDKAESIAEAKKFFYTDEQGPNEVLKKASAVIQMEKIGIEYEHMNVKELKALESLNTEATIDISIIVNNFKNCKDSKEVENMKKAVQIVENSLDATLPYIKEGVQELEIAAHLEYEMRKRGSEGTPFGTTVASGYRGALPHGRASNKQINNGELVVIDFGAIFNGYVADITRTVAVGEISNELKEIYQVVKAAQQKSVEIIKPGITAHEVDEAARAIIRDHGYGDYFTHRTGHGLGLNAHEEPYIMQNNEAVLQPGMAFTVEPGIYLPDKGGVRIEDDLIVTEDGCLNLMSYTKNLITL
ncbi:M24 family metallopeptidase [Scopulibacillus cellulosilyticus]|uniref:M24 family metallopeptidase n=1 Tax=Scopulibacillus cellulosilyticus TaxID=2665665 RepID=A0ABW2PSK5_9BACL